MPFLLTLKGLSNQQTCFFLLHRQFRPGQMVQWNNIRHCWMQHGWTMLHSVEWSSQTIATCWVQHLHSRICNQNLLRMNFFGLPRKSCETDKSFDLRIRPSSCFPWSYSVDHCLVTSLYIWREIVCFLDLFIEKLKHSCGYAIFPFVNKRCHF